MSNFFDSAKSDPNSLQDSLLGPRYDYSALIKNPSQLGMSNSGDKINNNFKGIQAYIDLLFSGGGKASKTGGPMGPQFFLKTGAKCKDIDSGEQVTRSIYINTIPLENTGVLSGFNSTFGGAQGFVPAIIHNISNVNPLGIFGSFMEGSNPDCQGVNLPTRRQNEFPKREVGYLTINDIKNLSPCLFENKINPLTGESTECLENFENINSNNSMNSRSNLDSINNFNNKDLEILDYFIKKNYSINKISYFEYEDLITYLYFISLIILFISLIK